MTSAPSIESVRTTDTDEAAAAIEASFGYGLRMTSLEMTFGFDLIAGDMATATEMFIGADLHLAFRRERDQTPMEYVRAGRIASAHADVVAADPTSTSVGEIAAAWGFTNRGRFARAYMATYGQSPSTTLRQ